MIYAYLRISDKKQSYKRQQSVFKQYIKDNGIDASDIKWIEETVSGTKSVKKRDLQTILDTIASGDIFITDEVSRIGRTSLEVISVIHTLIEKKVKILIMEPDMQLKDDIASQAVAFGLSIAAQIERAMISSRTRTGLQAAKESGKTLGRPKGSNSKQLKLDHSISDIEKMIEAKISKAAIARSYHVSRTTLDKFIKSRNLMPIDPTDN